MEKSSNSSKAVIYVLIALLLLILLSLVFFFWSTTFSKPTSLTDPSKEHHASILNAKHNSLKINESDYLLTINGKQLTVKKEDLVAVLKSNKEEI